MKTIKETIDYYEFELTKLENMLEDKDRDIRHIERQNTVLKEALFEEVEKNNSLKDSIVNLASLIGDSK